MGNGRKTRPETQQHTLARLEKIRAQRDVLLAAMLTIKVNAGNPEVVYRTATDILNALPPDVFQQQPKSTCPPRA